MKKEKLDELFIKELMDCKFEKCKSLIESKATIKEEYYFWSLTNKKSLIQTKQIIKFLYDSKANPNINDDSGTTLLFSLFSEIYQKIYIFFF